jgi:hypothetical protein
MRRFVCLRRPARWTLWLAANMLLLGVLGLYQTTDASQKTGGQPPFANPVEQRQEMIGCLREIRDLLREQNALLRSGEVKVVVEEAKR